MDNFFVIKNIDADDNGDLNSRIKFNLSHKIFLGHFPENPIVPGVMSINLVKQILSKYLKKELMLIKGNNIKFTAVIKPDVYCEVDVNINFKIDINKLCNVKALIFSGELIFLKFAGVFKFV